MSSLKIKSVEFKSNYNGKKYRDEKTVIYFHIEDENVFENLVNRKSRPYTEYKKLIPEVIAKLQEKGLEINPNTKVRWSQYAGCKCPCSPGFIVDGYRGHDIWVTI